MGNLFHIPAVEKIPIYKYRDPAAGYDDIRLPRKPRIILSIPYAFFPKRLSKH